MPYDRDEGFYWVRRGSNQPEVAQWDSERWWTAGSLRPFEDGEVLQLSEDALAPPTADRAAVAADESYHPGARMLASRARPPLSDAQRAELHKGDDPTMEVKMPPYPKAMPAVVNIPYPDVSPSADRFSDLASRESMRVHAARRTMLLQEASHEYYLRDDEPGSKAAVDYLSEWIKPGLSIPELAIPVIAIGMVRAVDRARLGVEAEQDGR